MKDSGQKKYIKVWRRSGLILGPQDSSPNSEAMDLKKTKMKKKEKKRRPGICQIKSSSKKEKCQQTGKQSVFKHSKKAPTANPPEQCALHDAEHWQYLWWRTRQQESRPSSQAGARGSVQNHVFKKFFLTYLCQNFLSFFSHRNTLHIYIIDCFILCYLERYYKRTK